jgi:hypothetical protein
MSSNLWNDFHSEHEWRFPEIAPWQIQRNLGNPMVDPWERVRVEWMWKRRPNPVMGEGAFGYILIITISLLLLTVPHIGIFLDALWLLSCLLLIAFDVVRNVRWRRDYESSLRRMIRTMRSIDR